MARTSIAIYVIGKGLNETGFVAYALEHLSMSFDRVVAICAQGKAQTYAHLVERAGNVELIESQIDQFSAMAGYRQALLHVKSSGADIGPIMVTGSHVFGPVHGIDPAFFTMDADGVHVRAAYWHDLELDARLKDKHALGRVPYLDFAAFSPALAHSNAFWDFWEGYKPDPDHWADFNAGTVGFGNMLKKNGFVSAYPMADDALETADPRLFEVHRVLQTGGYCLPVAVFQLDPLLHDLNAIYLRDALDYLRHENPELYAHLIRFVTRHIQMRELNTITDQYEVLADTAADPEKQTWSFGPVAVFIHAFYANMMPEFWELIGRIPGERHLFITTATEEDATHIRNFLGEHGHDPAQFDVRVVKENRGRDMSSLFITFRDVIMDNRYEVALRLHSKRTPQVSRQVGNSFRDHLFDNLAHSKGYVRNVLDLLERERDIGLIIPPVIHIGFGTLGHSWFNNKQALYDMMRKMGMQVPLDEATPVAAYGTMYWFRTDALRRMFEWEWKWKDYNPEPHHIDGGLAHIQERMIGYCVQDAGYRVMQVMNPRMAARGYARLEYKLQMFASFFGSNNIMQQKLELENANTTTRRSIYRRLRMGYGRILRRFPASRRFLRPFKDMAIKLLSAR